MAVKKKKDEELQQSQPQRNSTYSYGRENSGNAYTYGSKGELVSTGKNIYSSTKGYNQKASFVAYDKKTSGSTKQRTSGSSWTPGGSNPTGAQKYDPATMERIKSDTTLYKKWYSGSQPTLRETVARMYQVADGDEKKFAELEGMLYQEMATPSSVIYNPYNQATNTHAIEVLENLGIDVSGGITPEWLAANKYMQNDPRTVTGHNPLAPSGKSTAANNLAWAYDELEDAEERTLNAENEVVAMANEVKYWTERGYSDKTILKKIKENKAYSTLWEMDDKRLHGEYSILNRAINYNGDDTIYGMIWAARNDGGSGDYFVDSVKYAMGEGNRYKRDPDSEAARDPSSYESYDPYSYGGTLHDLQQKYGVDQFTKEWLDANRSTILSNPDGSADIEKIVKGIDQYDKAMAEVAELDKWLENNVNKTVNGKPITAEDLVAKLEALIDEGGAGTIKVPTLKKMEDERYAGTYLALSGAVPFTLPQYIEKAQAMVAERDAAKAQKEAEEAEKPTLKEKFTEGVQNFVGKAGRFLASMGIKGVGSYGESIDSALEAQENAYDANTIGKNFASSELGVEIHGDLKPYEQAAVNDMVAKVEIATQPKATLQQIDEANAAVAVLQDLLVQAANDPARQEQESYKTSEAWTSVVDALQNPREGMVEMVAEPTAFLGELESQQQPQSVEDLPQMQAYANILQGGEWNGAVIDWAFAHSNNENAIMAELVNGIMGHKIKGQELTGIAKSWWDKFGGLVDDLSGPETYDQLDLVDMGLADYDSRTAYGTQIFGALQMNEEAYEADAITPEQYAQNLIRISDLAEGISEMTDGARATDEQADSFLENVEGASGILEKVYDVCNTGMEEQRKDLAVTQRQREAANIEVLRQYTAGEEITDPAAFFNIMLTDTTEAAASDKAYQDASAFFGRTLGFDGIADDGIAFTTGDTGMDASYGKDFLMAEGASLYSKGVSALAQATLDTHMKFATACGMSLEQFYQEFPEYARTPGQIAAEARSEYHGAWGEFGMTIEGLVSANDSIMNAGADVEGAPTGEQSADTLDVSDLIALAYDKVTASNALNLDKTLYTMQHAWKDEESERDMLLTQHGSREGVAAEWDKVISEREQNLRNTYENDITAKQKGLTYEQWREGNTDKALDELLVKRDTAKDILDLGDPAKWSSEQAIIEKTGNIENIDKLVAENGSEFDKKVYDGVTGLMQTGQFMYQSIMLGGGYGASLAATLTSSGADAFDRFMESGDYDAALLASAGAWLVNAAIETSLDRFAPAALGGDREWKMMQARANLSKLGVFGWMKDPKSMSKAAQSVLNLAVGGVMNAGGEGVEEALQTLVDSMADNVVYGTGLLPTGEQLTEAGQAFVSGAAMGAVMEGGSNLMFGAPVMTDHMGNAISKAEAQLLPETDGVILNTAIDFEATAMAIANSGDALAQIEASSENQQLQEVTKQMQEIDAELAEAESELAAAEQEQADAVLALEAVDNERVESDVFTEDMSKRMVAAATNLQAASEKVGKSRERAEAARNRKAEAQQHHDELKAKVQGMYNQVMDEAKERYSMVVAEKYYGNDTAEQQSASNAYLEACKEMQDIKKKLAEARAEMNTYGTGTPRGEQARKNYGKRLLEADKAAEKVAMAKANMDAAYDNSPEARMENVHNAELAKAEQIAMEAAEAAAADPMNVRKAQAADVEQAKLDTIRAKQEMEEARSGISQRLNSPDSKVRDQAVSDWKALQQKASDAAEAASALEAEFNETDTQKNLRAAIDNMKQYDNLDLVDESSENHEAANDAYAELQAASMDAAIEQAMNELATAMDSPDKADAIADAVHKVDEMRSQKKVAEDAASKVPQPHIDRRLPMDATNKDMKPFFNEYREQFKDYVLVTARNLLADVSHSSPGQRIFIQGGAGNGQGSDQEVTGSGRITSSILGEYMDITKWSWKSMETYLSKFVDALESGKPLPNTAYAKKIEMMIDQALSEGYVGVFGEQIPPSLDYLKLKVETGGKQYKDRTYENEEGFSFYDMYGVGSPITPSLVNAVSEASKNIAEGERVTPSGEYILEIGNKFVYTDGNAKNPKISRVITFLYKGVDPDIDAVLREGLYVLEEEGRNQDIEQLRAENFAAISDVLETRYAFRSYDLEDAGRSEGSSRSGAGIDDRADGAGDREQVSPESNIQAWRNTGGNRGAAGSSGVNTVDGNPIEIMRGLTDSIQVGYSPNGPMNEGRKRVSSDILAFYNKHAKGIRVRSKYAGDLAIGLHEFGHAAHARLANLHATQAMIDALPDGVKKSYTNAELDGEAIAEFVVEYMYGRDRAVRAAGDRFVRDFERMMHADPELNAAISKARNQVELWNSASAAERAAAMIKDSNTTQQRDKTASRKGGAKRVIEKVITEVFDANEPLRKLGKSVYDAAKWSRWASERADVLMTRNFIDAEGNIIGKSLTERLDDIGFTADMEADAATYGVLQVAIERLDQKKPVFAESEFSRDDLIAAMKEIKVRNPIAAQAADVLTGFWKDVMDTWLVPNGLVKEDVRDALWQMYPHYLPTKRVVDVDWSKKDVKSGTFQLRAAKKGGVSLEVINPFQSIADMVDQAVRSVSRNQVMQEIDAVLSGGGLEWLAKEITEDMAVTKIDTDEVKNAVKTALDSGTDVDPDMAADAFNLLDDMEEQWRSTGRSLRPNVIAGRRADGTAFYYQVQQGNEDLFRAAMGSKAAANGYFNTARKITRAFSALTTQLNPAFSGKNAPRDFRTSVNTGTWAFTYLDGAAKWMWGLYQIATDSKLHQEFDAVGGGSHTRYSNLTEKKLREAKRNILGKKDTFPVRAAKLGMKIITLSSINDVIEENSRFVEYALGKHDRSTFEGRREAAIAAQDVTVDFGMAGANETLQGWLAHIPFGRAALNGSYKEIMRIRDIGSSDPRTRERAKIAMVKTVINNGLEAVLQACVVLGVAGLFGGNDDDERKREEYKLITDEMKAGYFLFPLNQDKTNAKGYDRPWVRIAMSQSPLEKAVRAFALNSVFKLADADELTMDLVSVGKSILTDSAPGEFITANISNAMMNRTWYGGEIVSSYMLDSRSGVNQYKDDTPSAFKALSNAIYNASGKEISPAVLQYIFEQSTGYVGKVVIPLISGNRHTGEWSLKDAGKNFAYSFMKNFTLDPLTSNSLSQEYDNITSKIDKIVNEAEEGLPITYLAYSLTDAEREEAVAEAKALQEGLMKQTKAENNILWQEIRDIEASSGLSESEKTIQVREVRREIDHNTAEALAELGEYMQTYVYRDPWVSNVLHLFDAHPTLD